MKINNNFKLSNKRIKKMNRKGELTTTQIVTIILVLVAFVIILFILYQMFSYGKIDQDACHTSVVIRGTMPVFGGTKDFVPLKCKTEKICITSGLLGGKCPDYGDEKGISYVKVDSGENGQRQIEQLFAQNIVRCWQMMGEGKVSIFSEWVAQTYGFGAVYPSCVICNRIAFDKSSLQDRVDLGKINVQAYMDTHLVPGKNYTYSDFLRGENAKTAINLLTTFDVYKSPTDKINNQDTLSISQGSQEQTLKTLASQASDSKIQNKAVAIMFSQISAPTQGGSAANIGKTLLAGTIGSFVLAPSSTIQGGKFAGGLIKDVCGGGGAYTVAACIGTAIAAILYQQGSVAYNRAVTAGYCGDVSIGTDARNGCSVVRVVNYDVSQIMQHCGLIESIS
jgi:hypothetical protein